MSNGKFAAFRIFRARSTFKLELYGSVNRRNAEHRTKGWHDAGRISSPYQDRVRNFFWKRAKEWRMWPQLGFSRWQLMKWWFTGSNLVVDESGAVHFVDDGKRWVVDKMDDSSATAMNKIGWGTAAGTTAESDTTLFTEDSGGSPVYARATATLTQQTTTVTDDTYQAVGTLTSNGTKTITNAGLFDAASSGNMLIKGDHAGVPLLLDDQIQYTFKLHVDQ